MVAYLFKHKRIESCHSVSNIILISESESINRYTDPKPAQTIHHTISLISSPKSPKHIGRPTMLRSASHYLTMLCSQHWHYSINTDAAASRAQSNRFKCIRSVRVVAMCGSIDSLLFAVCQESELHSERWLYLYVLHADWMSV